MANCEFHKTDVYLHKYAFICTLFSCLLLMIFTMLNMARIVCNYNVTVYKASAIKQNTKNVRIASPGQRCIRTLGSSWCNVWFYVIIMFYLKKEVIFNMFVSNSTAQLYLSEMNRCYHWFNMGRVQCNFEHFQCIYGTFHIIVIICETMVSKFRDCLAQYVINNTTLI